MRQAFVRHTTRIEAKKAVNENEGANPLGAPLMETVCRAIDTLTNTAARYNGLVPSLLDCRTGDMLTQLPAAIPGQRNSDRAPLGSNLIHDVPLLGTMYALARAKGNAAYAEAADRYLRYFAQNCTATATGLFPWGEHAFWHLTEHRVGSSIDRHDATGRAIHDHLHQAPVWLWEKLHAYNPDCVQRFADGLEYHWKQTDPPEYYRHAEINSRSYAPADVRACDFPRHSGFYILDLAFAYGKSGRPELLRQLERYLDYWWEKRGANGLLAIESRSPADEVRFYGTDSPSQTLSLAVSLLEAAKLLDVASPRHASAMRQRADVYIGGFLSAPHVPEQGVFVGLCSRDDNRMSEPMSVWGSVYGVAIVSASALMCLCAWRLCGRPELLAWAAAAGSCYLKEPFPVSGDTARNAQGVRPHEFGNLTGHHYVPARDAGLALELLADLYAAAGDARWLEGGLRLAGQLVPLYFPAVLPRGAAGDVGHYESQLGTGYLLHGLTRLALLARSGEGGDDGREALAMDADYTCR